MRTYRSVRTFSVVFALVAALAVSSLLMVATADAQAPTVARFNIVLTGEAEVPGPGDEDGSGTARLIIVPELGTVCFVLRVRDIEPATAAHIHVGAVDEAGQVVIGLDPPTFGASGGCVDADPELLAEIVANPENYYVNVHNEPFPAGALRGQLA